MLNSDCFCKIVVVLLSDAMSMDFFLTKSKIVHSKKATLLDNCQQSRKLPATALYKSMLAKLTSLVSES